MHKNFHPQSQIAPYITKRTPAPYINYGVSLTPDLEFCKAAPPPRRESGNLAPRDVQKIVYYECNDRDDIIAARKGRKFRAPLPRKTYHL